MQPLFTPLTLRQTTFRNRVVMPPMVVGKGDLAGMITDDVVDYYAARARGGVGLIIVEATAVAAGGRCWPNGLHAYEDRNLPGLARLAEAIHAEGAVAGIQLVHGGPQASPALVGETVGPSAVAPDDTLPVPRPLTVEEILTIEEQFAQAAARVVDAGFDVVEIHGAHGYLLDSFLSLIRNIRTDAYGCTFDGRLRMLLETCRAVRARIGTRALLDCRISVFNKRAEGFTADDLRQLLSGLTQAGLDLLHISTDGAFLGAFGTDLPIGAWAKQLTTLPVIVAGGLGEPKDANRIIAEGAADFAAVGKKMLADPEWTAHAQHALAAD